jgi:hypothetical protein
VSDLSVFKAKLVRRIGRRPKLRPFVCDGSPLCCKVFIVGFNPATTMSVGFWEFWERRVGFNKDKWLKAYEKDRQRQRKRPRSNTRRVLDLIACELGSALRCLETNIYWTPSRRASDLQRHQRGPQASDNLRWLLIELNPRVIVVHGKGANKVFRRMGLRAHVAKSRHFSQLAHRRVPALARRIEREFGRTG